MLLQLTEIIATDGYYESEQRIALEPLTIESIRPFKLEDRDTACCTVLVSGEDGPLIIAGTLAQITAAIQGLDQDAIAKIEAIRSIIGEAPNGE